MFSVLVVLIVGMILAVAKDDVDIVNKVFIIKLGAVINYNF